MGFMDWSMGDAQFVVISFLVQTIIREIVECPPCSLDHLARTESHRWSQMQWTTFSEETWMKNVADFWNWRTPKPLLVGGLEHFLNEFPYIGNVIIPTDELIFFRGWVYHQPVYNDIYKMKPPTKLVSIAKTTSSGWLRGPGFGRWAVSFPCWWLWPQPALAMTGCL